MAKGHNGETCGEVVREILSSSQPLPFSEIHKQIQERGPWKDETIWQHLMSLVVNLPPARYHWKSTKPFLFLRPDGQYEIYSEAKHPKTVE